MLEYKWQVYINALAETKQRVMNGEKVDIVYLVMLYENIVKLQSEMMNTNNVIQLNETIQRKVA